VVDTAGQDSDSGHEPPPSAQDVREYVQRLRALPVEQVIGDVLLSLLNAAEVKLGRRDARLLIDMAAVAHDHARSYLPDELNEQVEQALGQLRLGQVSAEGHPGGPGDREENDLDRAPAPPAGSPQSPPGPAPSRLWVPGR
jgi:hypothetical protein